MPKFVKTVTKEVVDVDSLVCEIRKKEANCSVPGGVHVRLAMSCATRDSLCANGEFRTWRLTVNTPIGLCDEFEGCPIDINNSLGFGDIRISVEV